MNEMLECVPDHIQGNHISTRFTLDSRHETNYHLNNVIKSIVLEKDRIAL